MKKSSKGLLGVIAGALAGAAIFKYFQNKQAAEEVVIDGEDIAEDVAEAEDSVCECGCCCADTKEEPSEAEESVVEDSADEEDEASEEAE